MNKHESFVLSFLFIRGGPTKKELLQKVLSVNKEELTEILTHLKTSFENLPFAIIENDEEIELTLNKEMTEVLDPYLKREKEADLTPSTLQTLTIIAYLDKPSKFDISFIRGVSSAQSIGTLLAKGLIEEFETDTYSLSLEALSHLGVEKKEDLPDFVSVRKSFQEKIHNAIS